MALKNERKRRRLIMRMRNAKKINIFDILKTQDEFLTNHHVKRIGLFGSFARGEEHPESDIDLMVEIETPDFNNFMDLSYGLEELFKRKVELITDGSLSPYIQPYVEKEVKWYETELAVS